MRVEELITELKKIPLEHEILISAKGRFLEITGLHRMAYTLFIKADKTPYEVRKTKRDNRF
jgi:hypothetical protein